MVGLGGPIVALWLVGYQHPLIMAMTIILVSISRLILKAHTPNQIIAGIILAIAGIYLIL